MKINLNNNYELGESKNLEITAYLPKYSKNHLGNKESIESVVCTILNDYYCEAIKKEYWRTDPLWFKPTKKGDFE